MRNEWCCCMYCFCVCREKCKPVPKLKHENCDKNVSKGRKRVFFYRNRPTCGRRWNKETKMRFRLRLDNSFRNTFSIFRLIYSYATPTYILPVLYYAFDVCVRALRRWWPVDGLDQRQFHTRVTFKNYWIIISSTRIDIGLN